jgi:hypothetical protein
MSRYRLVSALALSLLVACGSAPTSPTVAREDVGAAVVPPEALSADVRQETIQQTICVPGYAASVRPSTSYTNGVKSKLLRDQGLPPSAAPEYELDHRIPLALGGHPRSLKNLELQAWEGDGGAKRKDRLERRLQQLVCAGKVPLDEARREIYLDWKAAFPKYIPGP